MILTIFYSELQKVPSSASVLVRKDFRIRETLRKAAGGKKYRSLPILGEEKKVERKE